MAQLAVWLGVCVVVALSLQRRPVVVLVTVLLLRIAVPSSGGWVIIGDWSGNAAIHPATLLLLIWAPFALLGHLRDVGLEITAHRAIYGSVGLATSCFVVVAVVQSGPTSLIGLTNSVLAGVLFFFCVRVIDRSRPGAAAVMIRTLIGAMVVESLLVVAQWALGSNLPWSIVIDFPLATRPLGTFDSPLDLGMAVALTVPLLATVQRSLLRYGSMIVLVAAAALSESRTPTVLAALGAAYLVLRSARSARSFIAMVLMMGAGLLFFANVPVLAGLIERFVGDDGNSTAARSVATDYIVENIGRVLIFGEGWGSSYKLKGTLLETSLENGYAILAFDLGGVSVALLLVGQVLMILSRKRGLSGAWVASIVAIVGGFAYSGITTMSAVSIVMWLAFSARITPPIDEGLGPKVEARSSPEAEMSKTQAWLHGARR